MKHNYASPPATVVVKYGGNAFAGADAADPVLVELAKLVARGTRTVLVHGGGPEINHALASEGITTTRIEGLRVTDARTLEITEAVLCGTINKRIVRQTRALGIDAVGVSGQDAGILVAGIASNPQGDLGFVGTVDVADSTLLDLLLSHGYLPVVAPLAVSKNNASALNVNADIAAAAIAGALRADAFVAITNVPRVLRDPNDPASAINTLSVEAARAFHSSEACAAGMKPKLEAAISAVERGCRASYICDARAGAIDGAIYRNEATRITLSSVESEGLISF